MLSALALQAQARPAPGDPDSPPKSAADDLPPGLPPEVAVELTAIAAEERSIRGQALERWDFAAVRGRYEALLRRADATPLVRSLIQGRLDQVVRDQAAGQAARDVDRLLRRGNEIDAQITTTQRHLAASRTRTERGFDAQGLLQPTSRQYQGQKVHALIGPEGTPVGYLKIPPGVPVGRYLAKKVGVRGVAHFDEGLGARIISVRDLEILERQR